MSKKVATALTVPPCEHPPRPGSALVVGTRNDLSATRQLLGAGIASGAVSLGHLGVGIRDVLFGAGYGGEYNFDGVNDVTGASRSGATYTVTGDIHATRMRVAAGATVDMNGWKLFARELILVGTAIIHNDGKAGNNGSGQTAGTKPGPKTGVTIGSSSDGGDGGTGGTAPNGAGVDGNVGATLSVGLGHGGGSSQSGEGSGGAGGAGQSGGSVTTAATDVATYALDNLTKLHRGVTMIGGGAGGAGGGGGGASAGVNGGGGGSGASGGGVLLIAVERLILSSWTGRISANGGIGGNGATSLAGDGGGGGGGGGGFVQLLYVELTGGTLSRSPLNRGDASAVAGANVTANGGAGGNGGGGGSANPGTHGLVRLVFLGDTFLPASEQAWLSSPQRRIPPMIRPSLSAGHLAQMRRGDFS